MPDNVAERIKTTLNSVHIIETSWEISNDLRDKLLALAAQADATNEWRCFHCDEVFTNPEHALEHFGRDEGSTPACKIRGSEGHLITYIRRLEAELWSYRNDSDLITRAWMAKESEHAQALLREEEKGYARGVRDMTKLGCCPEPAAHVCEPERRTETVSSAS